MKIMEELDISKGSLVLLRAEFNVDVENGKIVDDFRIKATLPTIEYLIKKGAKILILSDMGRPHGVYDEALSLKPVARHLSNILDNSVELFPNLDTAKKEFKKIKDGGVIMLENLRFDIREEQGSMKFAQELASLGEFYVNDAFGLGHRKHASTYELAKLLPHGAGKLLQKEVSILGEIRENSLRPLVFVMGGAKVETKLKILSELFDIIDDVCLGGLMANSILAFSGKDIGKSWHEKNIDVYMKNINLDSKKIHMPKDVVVSKDTSGKSPIKIVSINDIGGEEIILDVGPETIEEFSKLIKNAGTVVWNGPLGLIEVDEFSKGTKALVNSLLSTNAKIVVGGGDFVRIINEVGATDKIYYISTGGGAMLEYLAEGTLPAIEVLN